MREGKNIIRGAISQWLDCYIDYQYLKIYIGVITRIVNQTSDIQEILEFQNDKNQQNKQRTEESQHSLTNEQRLMIEEGISNVKIILEQINSMFTKAYKYEVQVCAIFCVLKQSEVEQRYRMCLRYQKIADQIEKKRILLPYSEYAFIQAAYLKRMEESNVQAQRKILKKHKKYAQKMIETPQPQLQDKLDVKKIKKLVDQFEDFYVQFSCEVKIRHKKQKKKVRRDYLRSLTEKIETTKSDTCVFGLWVGIFLAVILFMILLLVYQKKSVQTDPIFNRDFPTWRGIAYIIFYVWIIGLNVILFQRFKISHRIIFDFNQHYYSRSTQIFKIAGLLSSIFAAMFTIYALNLADIITLIYFPSQYLSLIVWGLFIVMLFNPFPIFYYRSRIFILKLFIRIIISPAFGVPFVIGWATDQLLSLITPFQDMAYTICYYTSLDFSDATVANNNCRNPAKIAVFAFAVTIFSYRIFQCIRQGYDKKKYFFEHQFFNTVKYIFSLLTLVLSYLWRGGNQNIFAAWLVFAISSSIYSYVWDLKIDWALLEKNSTHCLLREDLIYDYRSYYVMMISNLILRLAWVLTLSQNITDKTFGSPEIFRLITGALEIIRRGIWNLLRLEKQQLKNSKQFKAIQSIRCKYEGQIKKKLDEQKDKVNQQTQQRIVEDIIQPSYQFQSQGAKSQKQSQSGQEILENSMKEVKNLGQLRQKIVEIEKDKRKMLSDLYDKQRTATSFLESINTILKY